MDTSRTHKNPIQGPKTDAFFLGLITALAGSASLVAAMPDGTELIGAFSILQQRWTNREGFKHLFTGCRDQSPTAAPTTF